MMICASLAANLTRRDNIGVNLGDVIVEGDDIFGDGVNVAARLEGLAKPGEVAVTSSVREQIGIGHIKNGHRMDRNYLAGTQGNAINAILAAAGYNFRLLLTWLRHILCFVLAVLFRPVRPQLA